MNTITLTSEDITVGDEVTVWKLNARGQRTSGQEGTVAAIAGSYLTLSCPLGEIAYNLTDDFEVVKEVPQPQLRPTDRPSSAPSRRVGPDMGRRHDPRLRVGVGP